MNKIQAFGALVVASLFVGTAQGQEQGSQDVFVYATYFICSPDQESRADEIIATSFKPHYDQAVEQGAIVSWSWQSHFVGGKWRRALVIIAADMDSVIDASGALGEAISGTTPEAGRAFSSICFSHDDYVWETTVDAADAGPVDRRGAAGFSVYMKCDVNMEEEADKLIREVFGPIYDRYVSDGELASWNWLRHNVGGEWRRTLVMSGEDHKSLARVREAILNEFSARKTARATEEMNDICHTHQDYMWDILEQST